MPCGSALRAPTPPGRASQGCCRETAFRPLRPATVGPGGARRPGPPATGPVVLPDRSRRPSRRRVRPERRERCVPECPRTPSPVVRADRRRSPCRRRRSPRRSFPPTTTRPASRAHPVAETGGQPSGMVGRSVPSEGRSGIEPRPSAAIVRPPARPQCSPSGSGPSPAIHETGVDPAKAGGSPLSPRSRRPRTPPPRWRRAPEALDLSQRSRRGSSARGSPLGPAGSSVRLPWRRSSLGPSRPPTQNDRRRWRMTRSGRGPGREGGSPDGVRTRARAEALIAARTERRQPPKHRQRARRRQPGRATGLDGPCPPVPVGADPGN